MSAEGENITFSKYAFYFINNSLYFITLYIINIIMPSEPLISKTSLKIYYVRNETMLQIVMNSNFTITHTNTKLNS